MPDNPIRFFQIKVGKDAIRVDREPLSGDIPNCPIQPDDLQLRTAKFLVSMLREGRLKSREEFQILGEHLYEILLNNKIGDKVNEALHQPLQFMRVELEFEEGQEALSSLPWEFIYFPAKYVGGGGYFLAQEKDVVLTRRLRIETPRSLRIDKPPLKILFVASSPKGYDVEYNMVLEVIKRIGPEMIKVTPLLPYDADEITPKATWPNFTAMLENEEFHAIHFVGHGKWDSLTKGTLLFMRKDGTADLRAEDDVATTLMRFTSLRMVFLQACESAQSDPHQAFSGVAQQLAQKGIPAVVGMQYKIQQQVANDFAEKFYKALAEKLPVDAALQRARRKIVEEFSDWIQQMGFGLPVLYLRESESLFAPAGPAGGQEKTSLSELVACPWCPGRNKLTDKYCGDCTRPLICPKCGTRIDRPRKSCGECNTSFATGVESAGPAMPSSTLPADSFVTKPN